MQPGDSDIVRLSILPLKPGLLRITGLEWVLNGQAQGKRLFAAKAPQHRRTGSRSTSAAPSVKPYTSIAVLQHSRRVLTGRSVSRFFPPLSLSFWVVRPLCTSAQQVTCRSTSQEDCHIDYTIPLLTTGCKKYHCIMICLRQQPVSS